jgi:hypothetical protein
MVVEASGGCSCSSQDEVAAGTVGVDGDGVCSWHMIPPVEVAVDSSHCTELIADSNHHGAVWGRLHYHGTSELLASSADFVASSC